MRLVARLGGLAVTLAASLTLAPRASAYVLAYSSAATGTKSLAWRSGCIFLTPNAAGTSAVPAGPDDEFAAANKAIAAWQAASDQCSYLKYVVEAPRAQEVGRDGVNVIIYRDTTWGRPAVDGAQAMAYDSAAAALTVVNYALPQSGDSTLAILDADIEVNAVDFRVSVDGVTTQNTPGDPRKLSEVQNTLTHELGHLIGLDHTCFQPVQGATRPNDDAGRPIPNCSPEAALTPAVRDATMYNFAGSAETKKETLEQDDINGLCGIYPRSANPNTCVKVDLGSGNSGCAVRTSEASMELSLWLAFAAFVLVLALGKRAKAPAYSRGRRP